MRLAQRNAMTQTQITEMDATLHAHQLNQVGFDQVGQQLLEIRALFVHLDGIKTMQQLQQNELHIEEMD